MARGGKREGAGRKSAWGTEQKGTKIIRLPVQLADALQKAKDNKLSAELLVKAVDLVIKKYKPATKSKTTHG